MCRAYSSVHTPRSSAEVAEDLVFLAAIVGSMATTAGLSGFFYPLHWTNWADPDGFIKPLRKKADEDYTSSFSFLTFPQTQ
jgi:hypothetical protein